MPTPEIKIGAAPEASRAAPAGRQKLRNLRGQVEQREKVSSTYYGLGRYQGAEQLKEEAAVLEGGVDLTAHSDKKREARWYEEKARACAMLMRIYKTAPDRLTDGTRALIAGKEEILRDLANQTVSGVDFADFRESFEKKHSKADVLGARGAYNVVLAFQRILDMYGDDPQKIFDDRTKLSIAIGKNVRLKRERFSKAYKIDGKEAPPPAPRPIDALLEQSAAASAKTDELDAKLEQFRQMVDLTNVTMTSGVRGVPPETRTKTIDAALEKASALKDEIFAFKQSLQTLLAGLRMEYASKDASFTAEQREKFVKTLRTVEQIIPVLDEFYAEAAQKEQDLLKLRRLSVPGYRPPEAPAP